MPDAMDAVGRVSEAAMPALDRSGGSPPSSTALIGASRLCGAGRQARIREQARFDRLIRALCGYRDVSFARTAEMERRFRDQLGRLEASLRGK